MSVCRICRNEVRDGEAFVMVWDDTMHIDCAAAQRRPSRRRISSWAAFSGRGQMALSEPQRPDSD